MSSSETKYTAEFFKRDVLSGLDESQFSTNQLDDSKNATSSEEDTSKEVSSEEDTSREVTSEEDTSREVTSEEDTSREVSSEEEISSDSEIEHEFNSEDRQISRLYREVVDDIMATNKLRESIVDAAIRDMKQELYQWHKKGFRKLPAIDFCRPENCCGYLRRYAICHTGLVKRLAGKFLTCKAITSRMSAEEILHNNHLKVMSLGGGPGNDIVGFCSALQEIPNNVEQLDLIVVDVSKGWKPLFPQILRKAKVKDFGTISQCLSKTITTGFMQADLTNDEVFRDENLSLTLGEADVILMVKLTSFLCDGDTDDLLHNVVNAMKLGAKLIFIDYPYDGQFFREIDSLDCVYHDCLKYELCFNPKRSNSPSIANTYAHVAVLRKKFMEDEDSFDSEED